MNSKSEVSIVLPAEYNILTKHFNICGLFSLFRYTHCMPKLYSQIKKIKKEQYDTNDRIVFTLYDIDFHLDAKSPGFTLYNLQLILADLHIPNHFCLILTNRPDYNEYTKIVQHQLTTDPIPIRSITNILDPNSVVHITPRLFNLSDIQFPFCVLSREGRPHRSYFFSQLFKYGLHTLGMVGYNNITSVPTLPIIDESIVYESKHLDFLSGGYNNNTILIRNEENRNTFDQFLSQYSDYKNFKEEIDLSDKDLSCEFLEKSPILQALIYIGLETVVAPSKLHISRISLRGIVEQRPFMLLAQPGMLKFLKSLGFKTFDDFWDESYDDIENFEDRVDALIDILKIWSNYSVAELHSKVLEMQSIIEYNYNYYVNDFEEVLKIELDKNCFLNLTQSGC